jgi:hypothetical protein
MLQRISLCVYVLNIKPLDFSQTQLRVFRKISKRFRLRDLHQAIITKILKT